MILKPFRVESEDGKTFYVAHESDRAEDGSTMTAKHEELCAKIRTLASKGSMTAQLCDIVEEYAARIVSLEARAVAAEASRERLFEQSVRDQARIAGLEAMQRVEA